MRVLFWLDAATRRPWVARIEGLCETYGLARQFIVSVDRRDGARAFLLEEGPLYQVRPAEGEQFFVVFEGGKERVVPTEEAMAMVQRLEDERARIGAAIDGAVRRVNFTSEGGLN